MTTVLMTTVPMTTVPMMIANDDGVITTDDGPIATIQKEFQKRVVPPIPLVLLLLLLWDPSLGASLDTSVTVHPKTFPFNVPVAALLSQSNVPQLPA
jgi:hypothetical protein